jgi:BirA family transcriptional regulator, biotin operon repressor / biotin---[acetyl-CoA-carboxylase] ligase
LADATFDRVRFADALRTRSFGHRLLVRAEVGSTNDVAWDAFAEGAPDGVTVVADAQTHGRGRAGRTWHTAPGLGLALSIALHPGCDRRQQGTLPLVAGLALAEGLEALGVRSRLKWPNDVLVGNRKLAGILCESRRMPLPGGALTDAVVLGVGVNVAQRAEDFPQELSERARLAPTSLALEGYAATREAVAAAFLNALEPLWTAHAEGGREQVLDRWRARADFWGRPVTVRTPTGAVSGTARALDADGGLVVKLAGGGETTVLAGDLDVVEAESGAP